MISIEFKKYLEDLLSETIISIQPLSGGDINDVYLLITKTQKCVVKRNTASKFPGMFEAEAYGLKILKNSNTFTVPEILDFGRHDDNGFLILSYIETAQPIPNFWEVFGRKLAALHQCDMSYFGLEQHNYIGNLPQYNSKCNSAAEFYISQRLQPQFKLAIKKGYIFSGLDKFYQTIESEIPNEQPSLIHGDLWSGNYIIDKNGSPCLIDPAIAYAPREMDIGMMHLFGGFNANLFETYNEVFPLVDHWNNRLPIWQLYYLLVHLNVFGSSYYKGIQKILSRYI
ncbi:fructosamine kinase family protein [Aquimarina sp. AU119]|uniref:fructosamine kinase family protein n=1 Tax=Aquimarina sp. AU119 TaxID=2108528 RepID=UPI000D685D8B|nr:fructosamine kinase family protein [Aquimarina sp. AU119]